MHLAPARLGADPEAVHQVRAGAGRLEVWLRLAGRQILRDDLSWLRRSAAAVRDIDVILAGGVTGDVRAALSKQREAAQRLLATALGRPRMQALLGALRTLPPFERSAARAVLERWSAKTLEEGDLADFDHDAPARLHRLRRSVRRLRFAREWLDIESKALHELQTELGDFHDLAVLQARIAAACDAPEDLSEQMQESRERAKKAWNDVREEILESL
jgi:CHAD domain-containing protein